MHFQICLDVGYFRLYIQGKNILSIFPSDLAIVPVIIRYYFLM